MDRKEIERKVIETIIEYLDVSKREGLIEVSEEDIKNITMDTDLRDLGIDSMGYLELALMIEEKLGIKIEDFAELSGVYTVEDLINFVKGWMNVE